jgi:hypothetical protein
MQYRFMAMQKYFDMRLRAVLSGLVRRDRAAWRGLRLN